MTTLSENSIFGKYRILRLLGQGGMADVYEAEDTAIGRRVALKVLPLAFARDEERARRFSKEIQACAQLDHPNIVSVFNVGELGDLHYYTMSVLPGGDLQSRLERGPLPPKLALEITRQIASALDYAHSKGFVHRDVKPENILFGEDGRAVLTDFGIALATTSGTRMTATGLSIGTPHYMSPEQARGKEVNSASDLYALGVVLYEMLSGRVPFDATDSMAIGIMHLQEPPPQLPTQLSVYNPVLDKLLSKEPSERYQYGQRIVEDLDRAERGEKLEFTLEGTQLVVRTQHRRTLDKDLPNEGGSGSTPKPVFSALIWILGGIALGLGVTAGLYLWLESELGDPVWEEGGASTTAAVFEMTQDSTRPDLHQQAPDQDSSAIESTVRQSPNRVDHVERTGAPHQTPADETGVLFEGEVTTEPEYPVLWSTGDLVARRSLSSPAQIPGLPQPETLHDVMTMEQRQVVLHGTAGRRAAELILVVHGVRSELLDDGIDPSRVTVALQEGSHYRIIYTRRFAFISGSAMLDYHFFTDVQLDGRFVAIGYMDAQGSRPFFHRDLLWLSEEGEVSLLEVENPDHEIIARAARAVEGFRGATLPTTRIENGKVFRTYQITLKDDPGCCPSGGLFRVDFELQVNTDAARLVPVRYGVISNSGDFLFSPIEVRLSTPQAQNLYEAEWIGSPLGWADIPVPNLALAT